MRAEDYTPSVLFDVAISRAFADLAREQAGLFRMVSDDLAIPNAAPTADRFQPAAEPIMQLCAFGLGHRGVHDVARQHMIEAVLAAAARPLFGGRGDEVATQPGAQP